VGEGWWWRRRRRRRRRDGVTLIARVVETRESVMPST
jgi:hypothetical protein